MASHHTTPKTNTSHLTTPLTTHKTSTNQAFHTYTKSTQYSFKDYSIPQTLSPSITQYPPWQPSRPHPPTGAKFTRDVAQSFHTGSCAGMCRHMCVQTKLNSCFITKPCAGEVGLTLCLPPSLDAPLSPHRI